MSETRFLYKDRWKDGTILTPSSEDPQHPATDTQIDTLSMYWKASTLLCGVEWNQGTDTWTYKNGSDENTVTIPLDQGATPGEIDFVAILGHNMEDTGLVITFEGADNVAFDSGLVSRTLTYHATNIFEFITAFTKQYVRLKVVGYFTDYPRVATIKCGNYFEPNIDYVRGYAPGIEDQSEGEYSDSMVYHSDDRPVLKKWRLPYWALNDDSRDEILALMEECKKGKAFIVVFDKDDSNNSSHIVRLVELSDVPFQFRDSGDKWGWDAEIIEVI